MPRGIPNAGFRKTRSKTVSTKVVEPIQSRFSINQRFGFVSDMVTMLSNGSQSSVIVSGPGGLGKSHTVYNTLIKNGFKDVTTLDGFNPGDVLGKKTFVVVKGYSTAKGLYRTLYENRNGVIVFDDCDSVLRDPVSLNLLKGALDSYSKRIISYKADIRDDDLPNVFEFKGRVVFISNLPSNAIDQAIISRSLAVDLTMTDIQKVERMRHLLLQDDFLPEYSKTLKDDAINLIESVVSSVKELSLRTLIQVIKIRSSNPNGNWHNLAEYAICG